MKWILASASPRRKELLGKILPSFEIQPSDAEELSSHQGFWFDIALENAKRKAEDIALRNPSAFVIGADTVIEFGESILGKPRDLAEAEQMLRMLSGQIHQVTTGVCIRCMDRNIRIRFAECSMVEFKELTPAAIRNYLESVYVLDKAGAYAIQEHGDRIIRSVSGDIDNVIGLPVSKLNEALSPFLD